jgi:hypothetical protein
MAKRHPSPTPVLMKVLRSQNLKEFSPLKV